MRLPKLWAPMPSNWIRFDNKLKNFTWRPGEGQKAASVAALQLYVTFCFFAERQDGVDHRELVAELTYAAIGDLTGLSKALISSGIRKLCEEGLIEVRQAGRKNLYVLSGYDENRGWCKLPVRPLVDHERRQILPFMHLTRRSKTELYALKMFLLFAAHRDNETPYTMCSFDTIDEEAGIPRSQINRAQTLMISMGLLDRIVVSREEGSLINEPNKYVLGGYRAMFTSRSRGAAAA